MKYIYGSRKILYIVMILFAISTFVSFNFFLTIYNWNVKPPMYLSSMSISFRIHQLGYGEDIDSSNTVSIDDFLEIANEYSETTILSQYTLNSNGAGIWSNTELKQPKIIEGRGFESTDFQDSTNVAIINKNYIYTCFEKDEKLILIFDNKEFEVIGMYDEDISFPNYLVNLAATNLENNLFVGDYIVDSYNYSEIINRTLDINPTISIEVNGLYDLDIIENIIYLLQQVHWIFILIGLSPFILLSASCIYFTYFYLEKIYVELKIYYTFGGTKKAIKSIIIKDTFKICLQSYLFTAFIFILQSFILSEFISVFEIIGSFIFYASSIFILYNIFSKRFINIYVESLWGNYDKLYKK